MRVRIIIILKINKNQIRSKHEAVEVKGRGPKGRGYQIPIRMLVTGQEKQRICPKVTDTNKKFHLIRGTDEAGEAHRYQIPVSILLTGQAEQNTLRGNHKKLHLIYFLFQAEQRMLRDIRYPQEVVSCS